MAVHPHNTPSSVNEPALPRAGLLRARVRAKGDTVTIAPSRAELPPEPLFAPAPLPSLPSAFSRRREIFGQVELHEPVAKLSSAEGVVETTPSCEIFRSRRDLVLARNEVCSCPTLPDLASTIHARRALIGALEHGFALLDALGLSPLSLDVIDDAIATLDALDARTEDLEDDNSLEDGGDHEPSLGALDRFDSQTGWAGGTDDDREEGDDNGIVDEDGYHEQLGAALGLTLPWSIGGYVG